VKRIASGRSEVALHELRAGAGPTLLALHALGGAAQDFSTLAAHWPGRVLALDFAGRRLSLGTRRQLRPGCAADATPRCLRPARPAWQAPGSAPAWRLVAGAAGNARRAALPGAASPAVAPPPRPARDPREDQLLDAAAAAPALTRCCAPAERIRAARLARAFADAHGAAVRGGPARPGRARRHAETAPADRPARS
jgi:hypothetical protein